jgi:hypothetical protein
VAGVIAECCRQEPVEINTRLGVLTSFNLVRGGGGLRSSRNQFCGRNAPKQRSQNIATKKRAPQDEDVNSDFLFDDFLQRTPFLSA